MYMGRIVTVMIFIFGLALAAPGQACMVCVNGGSYCNPGTDVGGTHCDLHCDGERCYCMTSGICGPIVESPLPTDPFGEWPVVEGECDRPVVAGFELTSADLEAIERSIPSAHRLLSMLLDLSDEGIVLGPVDGLSGAIVDDDMKELDLEFEYSGYVGLEDDELRILLDLEGHEDYSSFVVGLEGDWHENRLLGTSGSVAALGHGPGQFRKVMW